MKLLLLENEQILSETLQLGVSKGTQACGR